ncbi:MAG: hypothetical protein IJS01_09765 [Lentisphaeria bacterium]|nr:hypothetical protein [Lentisphaeria bacterium]
MPSVDPENDPQLRLKLLQAEENVTPDVPDCRRGVRFAPCGCLFFGAMGLPLLKIASGYLAVALIVCFALLGAFLTGLAAAYRPAKK